MASQSFLKILSALLLAIAAVHRCVCQEANVNSFNWDVDIFPKLPLGAPHSSNNACSADSIAFSRALQNLTSWAFQMWDASAKRPTGVAVGSVFALGNFDECSAISTAQYCLTKIGMTITPTRVIDKYSLEHEPDDIVFNRLHYTGDKSQMRRDTMFWGLCVPGSCTSMDIKESLQEHLDDVASNDTVSNFTYHVSILPNMCQKNQTEDTFDGLDVAFVVVLVALLLLVLGTTLWTIIKNWDNTTPKSKFEKLIFSISLHRNMTDLFSDPKKGPVPHLSTLWGIRFVCISIIIVYHRGLTLIAGPVVDYNVVSSLTRNWWLVPFFHGDLIVDSFFFISGLMAAYWLFTAFENKFHNPLMIIFLRYMRLTPIYAFVLFFYASIYYRIGSGPLWEYVIGAERETCRKSWWTNLLYINNYVSDNSMCMFHSWYLSCDTHYFIVATLLLPLLIKRLPRAIIPTLLLLLIASIAAPFAVTIIENKPPLLHYYSDFLFDPRSHDVFRSIYTKSHTRASPYVMGLIFGYFFYKKHNSAFKMSTLWSIVLAGFGFVLMAIVGYSAGIFSRDDVGVGTIGGAAYAAFNRPIWCVGSGSVFAALCFGHVPFIGLFLSWRPVAVLGKLSYAAYISHMFFQIKYLSETRSPKLMNVSEIVHLGIGDVLIAYMVSFFLYILLEGPVRNTLKAILISTPKQKDQNCNEVFTIENSIYRKKDIN